MILHKNMLVELEQYFFGDYEPIFGKSPKAQGVKFFFDVKKKMPQVWMTPFFDEYNPGYPEPPSIQEGPQSSMVIKAIWPFLGGALVAILTPKNTGSSEAWWLFSLWRNPIPMIKKSMGLV